MLIHLPKLVPETLVRTLRAKLQAAVHEPGESTAFGLARSVKNNLQLTADSAAGAELARLVSDHLNTQPEFREASIPVRITPPMFNLHRVGMSYGLHSDAALMNGLGGVLRADLSMTIFLSSPDEYAGGELAFADPMLGSHVFRLEPGDAVLYPTVALHEVRPVTRGERHACILWIQSAVRDPMQRHAIYQLGRLHRLISQGQTQPALTELNQLHQNLLRLWAQP